jgi:L-serine deaminase
MDRGRKGIVAAPTHGSSGLSTDSPRLLEHEFGAR